MFMIREGTKKAFVFLYVQEVLSIFSGSLYENGQDFLDTQYFFQNVPTVIFILFQISFPCISLKVRKTQVQNYYCTVYWLYMYIKYDVILISNKSVQRMSLTQTHLK